MSPETAPPPGAPANDPATLRRTLLSALYMLVRSAKLYDPENAVFQKPFQAIIAAINQLVAEEGRLELAVVGHTYYVNGQLVRVDQGLLENLKVLATELEARKIGGFKLTEATTLEELRNLIWIFTKNQRAEPGPDGIEGRRLTALRLTPWASHTEALDETRSADDRTWIPTVYARALVYMSVTLAELRKGGAAAPGPAVRLVQDLIDATLRSPDQVLRVIGNGSGEEALAYHLVNSALVAIAFGRDLALSKVELKTLGMAALFNEALLARLPAGARLRLSPDRLPPAEQARLKELTLDAARQALNEPNAGRLQLMRAVSSLQMHEPFAVATRDAAGKVTWAPKGDPLFLSRILALSSHFDLLTCDNADHQAIACDLALEVMWNQERWRFDPQLLLAFVTFVSRSPLKRVGGPKAPGR